MKTANTQKGEINAMTEQEQIRAADELRIAALKKEHFEKLLIAEGFSIDYSPDGCILDIKKPETKRL